MSKRYIRTLLMAGAATASVTSASWAGEFSRVIVFGDRFLDAGQYVSGQTVFADEDEELGDRRERFTNRVAGGGEGNTWATRVSRALGYGDTLPSQPSVLPGATEEPASGLNYAAGFRDARSVRDSVTGVSQTSTILYRNSDGTEVIVPGSTIPGLLNDPDRAGLAENSIAIINGGSEDIERLANVNRTLADSVAPLSATFVTDVTQRNTIAESAALDIALSAAALRDAGAGLVVVSNLSDMGSTPEVLNEAESASQGLAELNALVSSGTLSATDPRVISARIALEGIIANPDDVSRFRTEGTNRFNTVLSQLLEDEDGIVVLDQNSIVAEIIADPERFGLSGAFNQSESCLESSTLFPCDTSGVARPSEVFFNDGSEITTSAHALLADHASSVISAPVLVSGIPFSAIAAGREASYVARSQVIPERIREAGWRPFISANVNQSTRDDVAGQGGPGVLGLSGSGGVIYDFEDGFSLGVSASYKNIDDALSGAAGVGFDGSSVSATLFAGADFGRIFGNAVITAGQVDYDEIVREARIGAARIENTGSSEADVYGASLEVGYRSLNSGIVSAGPIVAVDRYEAEIDGYRESGWTATAVEYDDIKVSTTTASLGMFLEGGNLKDAQAPIFFRAKALYTRELENGGGTVTARSLFSPTNTFSREGQDGQDDSLTIGAQLIYDFGAFIGSIGYDARIGGNSDHSGRVDVSVPLGRKL